MTFFGLSILIASISFICYKHPPTTWSFLTWLRQLQSIEKTGNAPPSIQEPLPTVTKNHDADNDTEKGKPTEKETIEAPATPKKEEADRIAMPPPPPPTVKSPSSPTTPRANPTSNSSSVPSFTLSDTDAMPPPSFPALNSAQRASGGIRGPQPPRLNAIPAQTSSLMAPPPRPSPLPNRGGPLPNRSPVSNTSSLALPPTHSSIPAKPRKKVQLTPNHSPLDWARLSSSPRHNLNGLPPNTPYLKVPPSLLRQFTGRKGKDAWTVLGGKVYNITPYLPYHPGGEAELMRCAGKDGTRLFGEVHPWVNWEGMLGSCLVGVAVEEGEAHGGVGGMEDMD
ncbi:Cytochrome b5 reductase 4 [Lachnellula arida]|uniref:Cytochrome b5 reductase 4 n=1 Tax=Lachnellula arida TaxID=1316785 RepID=A0A8T9BHS3_9HELO|nr:Cytochrome b5 reductase 4 [Lachnellula arida]